jgi:hypothetical protein
MVRTFHPEVVDVYLDELVRVYEDYKANCVLITGHSFDKQRGTMRKITREVCRERGIPMLILDYEHHDPRRYSEEDIRHNVGQFFSTVALR